MQFVCFVKQASVDLVSDRSLLGVYTYYIAATPQIER